MHYVQTSTKQVFDNFNYITIMNLKVLLLQHKKKITHFEPENDEPNDYWRTLIYMFIIASKHIVIIAEIDVFLAK